MNSESPRIPERVNTESGEHVKKASLNQVAIQIASSNNHSLDYHISEIDLGEHKKFGDKLAQETINDPRHTERSGAIRVRKRFRKEPLVYTRKVFSRHQRSSSIPLPRPDGPFMKNVGSVHIHPAELPPSPTDLAKLLTFYIPELAPFNYSWGFEYIPTINRELQQLGRQYLVFRGPKTPKLTRQEAMKIVNDYYNTVHSEAPAVSNVSLAQTKQDRENEERFFDRISGEKGYEQATRNYQELLLMELAEQLDLKVFIVKPGETIARKQKLQKP